MIAWPTERQSPDPDGWRHRQQIRHVGQSLVALHHFGYSIELRLIKARSGFSCARSPGGFRNGLLECLQLSREIFCAFRLQTVLQALIEN